MVKKLHSFRCEDELWNAISAKADSAGLSVNEAMEQIIFSHLGLSSGPKVKAIAPPIADLEARVRALEKAIAKPDVRAIAVPKSVKAKPKSKTIVSAPGEWLTTGEAHALMQARHGYEGALTTFRRHLRAAQKSRSISKSLRAGGVVELNFEERATANPKSNAVKWIKLGD